MRVHVAWLALFVVLISSSGFAREALIFRAPTEDHRDQVIAEYVSTHYPQTLKPYLFARADLNDDGIPEYIVRAQNHSRKAVSPHHILSVRRRQVTDWGVISAQKLEISDKKQGVFRQILVYNQLRNDFYHEIWLYTDGRYQSPRSP
jgi:hypothetical protein